MLVPIHGALGDLGLGLRVAFLVGVLFVYADLASAVAFPNTIEGLVYLRPEYVGPRTFLAVQAEAVVSALLVGATVGWVLF